MLLSFASYMQHNRYVGAYMCSKLNSSTAQCLRRLVSNVAIAWAERLQYGCRSRGIYPFFICFSASSLSYLSNIILFPWHLQNTSGLPRSSFHASLGYNYMYFKITLCMRWHDHVTLNTSRGSSSEIYSVCFELKTFKKVLVLYGL